MAAPRELAGRAAAVCRRPLPAKALREELVALVRRAVPFGGYNFPLTDPVSRVGTSPLADVPGLFRPRCTTVLALLCEGLDTRQIADRMVGARANWSPAAIVPAASLRAF